MNAPVQKSHRDCGGTIEMRNEQDLDFVGNPVHFRRFDLELDGLSLGRSVGFYLCDCHITVE